MCTKCVLCNIAKSQAAWCTSFRLVRRLVSACNSRSIDRLSDLREPRCELCACVAFHRYEIKLQSSTKVMSTTTLYPQIHHLKYSRFYSPQGRSLVQNSSASTKLLFMKMQKRSFSEKNYRRIDKVSDPISNLYPPMLSISRL